MAVIEAGLLIVSLTNVLAQRFHEGTTSIICVVNRSV